MIRTLWFMAKVALLIAAAIWLTDNPGTISVTWLGYAIETSMTVAVVAAVIAVGAIIALYRLVRAIVNGPRDFGRFSTRRRREMGLEALTRGMVAVAAGDIETAQRMARRAEDLLHEPPLTRLLSAQAAQLRGDDRAAKRHFTAMLDVPDTTFLGLRGLLTQALKEGDRVEALALAKRAAQLQPNTPWVLTTLFDLQARAGLWADAEESLRRAVQVGAVKPEEGRHRRAALLLERSFEAERRGREDAALRHARDSHELLPGFVPAATRYVRLLAASGNPRRASKVAFKTWRLSPSGDLAAAFREVLDGYDPLSRLRMFTKLTAGNATHVESRLALARAAMEAQVWGEARSHLDAVLTSQPTRRVYRLLADLERSEHHNDEAAQRWLLQALTAAEDPAWSCRACGSTGVAWAGLCSHCGTFDSLDWHSTTVPAASGVLGLDGGAKMTLIDAGKGQDGKGTETAGAVVPVKAEQAAA